MRNKNPTGAEHGVVAGAVGRRHRGGAAVGCIHGIGRLRGGAIEVLVVEDGVVEREAGECV